MGHIELGRLPFTPPWKRVHHLLWGPAPQADEVADALERAAHDRLTALRDDPVLINCIWLLARLASAAKRPDFEEALQQLGFDPRRSRSVVGFLAQLSARLRTDIEAHPESGPFGELASLTLRRVLHEAMATEQLSLLPDGEPVVERSIRSWGTPTALGHLLSRFFGDYLTRVLRYYVDKALPLAIGPETSFTSIAESERFVADLSTYATTLAASTDLFANRWFNLHDWTAEGAISREEVGGFVAHALEKLQAGLAITTEVPA